MLFRSLQKRDPVAPSPSARPVSHRVQLRLKVAAGFLRRCDNASCASREGRLPITYRPKRKRTNSRWPSMGINYSANRPDPDDPGGLGAEKSGIERTGPTQGFLVAIQQGGRWAEVGRYYDSANDPVTVCFWLDLGSRRSAAREFRRHGPLAEPRRWRDHVGMAWSGKVQTGFRKKIMPGDMTGGAS